MGLGSRTARQHVTAGAVKTAADPSNWWDFKPGQQVMTVDGYPGRVVAVQDGPVAGSEAYEVTLDNDMGGGLYTSSQLRHMSGSYFASLEGTAAIDYPELGDILVERPDPAKEVVTLGAKQAADYGPSNAYEDQKAGHPYGYVNPGMLTCDCDGTRHPILDHKRPCECGDFGHSTFDHDKMAKGLRHGFEPLPFQPETAPGNLVSHRPFHERDRAIQSLNAKTAFDSDPDEVPTLEDHMRQLHETAAPNFYDPPPADDIDRGPRLAAFHPPDLERHLREMHGGGQPGVSPERYHFGDHDSQEDAGWNPKDPGDYHDHDRQTGAIIRPGDREHDDGYGDPAHWSDDDFDHYSMLVEAGVDPDFRFHVTASWSDVRNKAKRIRSEGKVNIISATEGTVAANVKGDHGIYQTIIQRTPGSRQSVASWECGCKWASYSWGRTGPWRKYEGRMCSHALALQLEAQARGMFGRDVTEDGDRPSWLRPRGRVVVEYDKDTGKNVTRPATSPRKRDLNRTYSKLDEAFAATAPVVHLIREASATEPAADIVLSLTCAGIRNPQGLYRLATDTKHKKHKKNDPARHIPNPIGWGYGWAGGYCPQCNGDGCGLCHGTGLAGAVDSGAQSDAGAAGAASATTAAVNDAIAEPTYDPPVTYQAPWHATKPRDRSENPGSAGPLAADMPDAISTGDSGWGSAVYASLDEAMFEPEMGHEAAFLPLLAPVAEEAGAALAGGELAGGAAGAEEGAGGGSMLKNLTRMPGGGGGGGGSNGPTISQKPYGGEVDDTQSLYNDSGDDLTDNAGVTATLDDEPEAALPQTDGAEEDDEDNDMTHQAAVLGESVEEILANFQRSASHLMGGGDAEATRDAGDIAGAAAEFLRTGQLADPDGGMSKTALKDFTPGERAALISEGEGDTASNLDRLQLEGTHYVALEQALAAEDGDDSWLMQ